MKMTLIKSSLFVLMALGSSLAYASDPTITVMGPGRSGFGAAMTCNGPVCLQVMKEQNVLNVSYEGGYLSSVDGYFHMGLKINGRQLPNATIPFIGRTGYRATVSLNGVENGELEIYFFDNYGNYDSRFGDNYHFRLQR